MKEKIPSAHSIVQKLPWLNGLPNFVTFGRILLVPLIIFLIASQEWDQAFFLFLLAGLSDAIDGFLAKRLQVESELGAYLDPLADKALLVSVFVALTIAGGIPLWLSLLVISRDLMIITGILVAWLMHKPMQIRPLTISKLTTTAQISFVTCVLAGKAFDFPLISPLHLLVYITAGLTLVSMGAYSAQWLNHMSREP